MAGSLAPVAAINGDLRQRQAGVQRIRVLFNHPQILGIGFGNITAGLQQVRIGQPRFFVKTVVGKDVAEFQHRPLFVPGL